jgi:hypothetical protein
VIARLVAWLFRRRTWKPPEARVSERWLGNYIYEGIREERVREHER